MIYLRVFYYKYRDIGIKKYTQKNLNSTCTKVADIKIYPVLAHFLRIRLVCNAIAYELFT